MENMVAAWPYAFVGIFIFSLILQRPKRIPAELSLELILLQVVAGFYWILDNDYSFMDSLFVGLAALFLLGPFFSGFKYSVLSWPWKLILSIWSCLLVIGLAIGNFYNTYNRDYLESSSILRAGANTDLQYFLLGISGVYILENFLLLFGLLPGENKRLNPPYFTKFQDFKSDHVSRYLEKNTLGKHSLFWLIFVLISFSLNHYFQILEKDSAIWGAFVTFPWLIRLYHRYSGQDI